MQKEIQPSQLRSRWVAEMNNRIKIEYTRILENKKEDKLQGMKSFKEKRKEKRHIVGKRAAGNELMGPKPVKGLEKQKTQT